MSEDIEKDYRKLESHGYGKMFGNQKQHYAVRRIKARNMFAQRCCSSSEYIWKMPPYLQRGKWRRT